ERIGWQSIRSSWLSGLPAGHVRLRYGSTCRRRPCARMQPRARRGLARIVREPGPHGAEQIFLICSTIGRIDHGKEVEGKEEIHEEKGRPGAQKEEDNEIGG